MKITAVCAGLGLAVGGVLFVVLRFVVGQRVLNGVPLTDAVGAPRRFADYLPTDDASTVGSLRLLPVALGAGLVAGLLVGALLRLLAARRSFGRLSGPVSLAVSGLVVGSLLAAELHAYGTRTFGTVSLGRGSFGTRYHGFYAYSPITDISPGADGVFYGGGPEPGSGPWWPLLVTGAVVGLVVGALAAGLVLWTGRTRRA